MVKPIINLTIAYFLGIVLSSLIYTSIKLLLVALVFVFLSLLISYLKKWRFVTSILIYISFLMIGIGAYQLSTKTDDQTHLLNYVGKNLVMRGIITDEPIEENQKIFALLKGERVITRGKLIDGVKGKIRLIIDKEILNLRISYGQRIEVIGKLDKIGSKNNPQFQRHWYSQDVYGIVRIKKDTQIKIIDKKGGNLLFKISYGIKEKLLNSINETLKDPQKSVLQGILIGDKKAVPLETIEKFQDTGIMHILAVSGLNVSLISLLFLIFAKKIFCLSEKYANIFSLFLIGIYTIIAGLNPSVLRASLMIAALFLAPLFYRQSDSINSLFLAVFLLLILNPTMIYNLSFQFSFIVTLGIILVMPITTKLSQGKWYKWIVTSFLISLAAWMAILPLLIYYFHKTSIVALVLNILIVPLVGVIMWCGFITFILFNINIYLAKIAAMINYWAIKILLFSVEVADTIPYSIIYISKIDIFSITCYYGFLIALLIYIKSLFSKRIKLPKVI
ncbi:MAG: ComEC/Rec2 family competence protein [bacterium]|nr:competence protein ComEC family protein [bacterium]